LRETMKKLPSKDVDAQAKGKSDSKSAAKPASKQKDAFGTLPDTTLRDLRLGFLMHDVPRLRRVVFDDFMKPLGVTRSQWWVLAFLSRHDGMIQSDLADMLELGKAALGGLVDRLELSGLVERRLDDIDRRVKRVYLTSKGTHIVKEMSVKGDEMSEVILQGLSLEQRKALTNMLQSVKTNLLEIHKKT
jgi:MarR family transcriptional regulator, transcriptional regulator for hemolysin